MDETRVWVFNAEGGAFPGGVFSDPQKARQWIATHRLSGVLTAYPVDEGVYDWATRTGVFPAHKPVTAAFIGRFSSGSQEHYHFTDGVEEGAG